MARRNVELVQRIRLEAQRLGFDLVGIVSAQPATTMSNYHAWLTQGYHGDMAYLARPDAVDRRSDLSRILAGVRSIVAVGANYRTRPLPPELGTDPSRGMISCYAWGDDYHDVLTPRLRRLGAFVEAQVGGDVAHRAYVDTGPVLEREIAARAGLGFVGKNTNLIHPRLGSWLFLGELFLTVELAAAPSPVTQKGTCGECTRCLDACPTAAFVAPYILDARRCISYLTIELKGPIRRELRPSMGNHIFGCDICQEVCPWNRRFAKPTTEPAFRPRAGGIAPHLLHLMALDDKEFRRRFQSSPIQRTRRRGLLRNVCVALGNWGDPAAVPALVHGLRDHERLIRGHAAWALGCIASREAQCALEQALSTETEDWVRGELQAALAAASHQAPPV
jgi:epoxyqueuosine reductase